MLKIIPTLILIPTPWPPNNMNQHNTAKPTNCINKPNNCKQTGKTSLDKTIH